MADSSQVNTLKGLAGGIPHLALRDKCGGTIGLDRGPRPTTSTTAATRWGYIRDAIKNGLTAYNAWNMVLDKGGKGIDDTRKWAQNALLRGRLGHAHPDAGVLRLPPLLAVRRPGRQGSSRRGGDAMAFKNPDGSLVAVMFNSGGANSNYVVSIGGKKLQFAMPGTGWATVEVRPVARALTSSTGGSSTPPTTNQASEAPRAGVAAGRRWWLSRHFPKGSPPHVLSRGATTGRS